MAAVFSMVPVAIVSANDLDREWLSNEVLKQLQEIRRELKAARTDIQKLRREVASIQAAMPGQRKTKISNVLIGDKPRLGDTNAKIAIIEFSDFQCPYCGRHVKKTIPKLKSTYIDSGKVQYVMRDFPLSIHRQAKSAAIAANCAGEQGKYWQVHDALFKKKTGFKRELYLSIAKDLHLDEGEYITCLDDPKSMKAVDNDVSYASSIGVTATPKFFIGKVNGGEITDVVSISGARSFDLFKSVIDKMDK